MPFFLISRTYKPFAHPAIVGRLPEIGPQVSPDEPMDQIHPKTITANKPHHAQVGVKCHAYPPKAPELAQIAGMKAPANRSLTQNQGNRRGSDRAALHRPVGEGGFKLQKAQGVERGVNNARNWLGFRGRGA